MKEEGGRGAPWNEQENRLVVADYFAMLADELAGKPYNKAATLRALAPLLDDRSRGSIEFKRANISATLHELGFRYLTGYLPRGNFQRSLLEAVVDELQRTGLLGPLVTSVESAPELDAAYASSIAEVQAPPEPLARERSREPSVGLYLPRISSFPDRDASNRELGAAGEEWVFEFEKRRLSINQREDLAKRVEWTARDRGDGYGYDVRSFEPDGMEILVEVKTTRMGKRWPFIVTRNELRVSQEHRDAYRVYRVFRFGTDRGVFRLAGAIDETCVLEPKTYEAQAG